MAEEQTPAPQGRRLPHLLWGMIVRPRATLAYLRESGGRTWWVAALLAVLLSILPVVVSAPITIRETREAMLATQEQLREQWEGEMSADEQAQMEQAMSIAASPLITVVFPSVLGVVGLVVGWLVWGGALYLAGMALGGRSTFGQMFRMVIWTWLPYVLRGLLQTVYILVTGQRIANPGLSGLVQVNSLGQILLAGFLSRVDLYLVWNLILLVVGVIVITRLTQRKAVLITLGVWLLLTGLSLLPKLVGGLFAQQMGMGVGS